MWNRTSRCSRWIKKRQRSNGQHLWIIEKAREFQKNICFTDYAEALVWITSNCGKFLKRWKYQIPDLPPENPVCRSRSNSLNRTWNNGLVPNWDRSHQGCILSPCLFNLCAGYITQNARLDEAQVGIKIAGTNIYNLRYADDTTLMAESEEELKSLLVKVKEENEKAGLKLNIQKNHGIQFHHFMENRWGNSDRLFSWTPKSLQVVIAAMKLKDAYSWKDRYDKPR